ncbi:hypothetical protein PU683_14985 [Kosakonia cowanii]|uniref:hypothetical protein n=1 Tax=Kosakonia cowanii TaxID=208223 RepID=UPI0023F71982|nr:hypothetical protein [Kosakonia cowanii]MDF7760824.1 hypothetical protein [Kosakonia cowanii]
MKFMELSSESRSQAQIALGQLIVARATSGQSDCENLGRCVAAAFIGMERHDSAQGDEKVKIGDGADSHKTGRSGSSSSL